MSHTFIYLDESGCLGFKSPDSTQYFVITLLKIEGTDVQKKVIKAVKRTIKNKITSKNKKSTYELKGFKTSFSAKEYFIKQMPREGWEIYSVVLDKKLVPAHLQTNEGKNRVYNFLVHFLMKNVKFDINLSRLDLYLDKCKNAKEQEIFNTYIAAHINLSLDVPFNINHVLSHENPCIQTVDLFCWGIARRYEKADRQWFLKFIGYIKFLSTL